MLNGAVGECVPSTGTSALAPGTDATLPETSGTSGAASPATDITPGQKVEATFDAVPDLRLDGSVLSSAPTGSAISGVISYYVTGVLPQ